MNRDSEQTLPLPDKKIPVPVMLIGTFEIAIALLGVVILGLVGQKFRTVVPKGKKS